MNTYFIRHTSKLEIDKATIRKLYEGGIIAIHYPWVSDDLTRDADSESLNPDHYDRSGKSALKTLWKISKNGGYICAEYRNISGALIGYIEPNTPIELFDGIWGSKRGSKKNRHGDSAKLKSLKLSKFNTITKDDYASLSVARPRQGTLVKWPSVKKRVENIVTGERMTCTLADLRTDQQETMCAEFLRFHEIKTPLFSKLETLILPVGRTMKDIDIAGVSENGNKIFAQVTYGKLGKSKNKIARLKEFNNSSDSELILFCNCDVPSVEDGIVIFPIQRVFECFTASEIGQRWINAIN